MAGILNGSTLVARFVAPMSVISNKPVFVTDTLSLKQRTGSMAGAQRWEIQTNLEPLVGDPSLYLHMITSNSDTVIDVEMPQMFRRGGGGTTATASLSASAQALAGVNTLSVGNNTGTKVAAGEFITFSNHNKVYMVTADRIGDGALTIFPALQLTVPLGTLIRTGTSAVKMKARYSTDTVKGMIYTDGVLMDVGQVTLIEAI
jgi:hypothetical protein